MNYGKNSFSGRKRARLSAARQLQPGGLDALIIVAEYKMIQAHADIKEPYSEVGEVLQQVWNKEGEKYLQLPARQMVDEIAQHYLGKVPLLEEVLPPKKYKQIVHAVQVLLAPAMALGRIDGMFAGNTPKYTLQRIMAGYERIQRLSSPTEKET